MGFGGIGESARKVMEITTSSGAFLVLGMEGSEELGRMPEFRVRMVGELDMLGSPKEVDLEALLGTQATVKMEVDEENPRHFNGYITRMQQGEQVGRFESFTATIRPWLWFATRSVDSRVFQAKNVKDIVTEVLTVYSADFEFRLVSASVYPKLDYCVQYQESDFEFVSRLLEYFGIYYFFEHEEGKHTMVLVDSIAKHKSKPIKDPVRWANAMKYSWTILNWRTGKEARSAKAVVRDYDYLAPTTEIKGEEVAKASTTKLGKAEVFEFPGDVVQNSAKDAAQPADQAAKQRAKMLIQELNSLAATSTGTTNTYDMATGMTFKLDGHPRSTENVNYLIVASRYRIEFADHEAIDDLKKKRTPEGFIADIVAISMSAGDFRTARTTPRPRIPGAQTAVVVGAAGSEMECDKHGRIKIQFPWDRLGKNDENSSCWVRVAQAAGHGHGSFAVPRIGDEVVVQFIDGDPDRPLVTGSVYNDEKMPAWTMPDHATVSGLRTLSTEDGTAETANELRFEDKRDSEYVWFQAQKDFYRYVKNDAFDNIGNNETVKVALTRKEVIGEKWLVDVTDDVMQNFGKDLHVKIAGDIFHTGGATWQIKLQKDLNVKLDSGDLGLDVGAGKIQAKATNVVIEASGGILLKCGGSLVNIGPGGVDIVGSMVKVNSGGGGGSASPKAPDEAKKEDSLGESSYDDNFTDPMPKSAA